MADNVEKSRILSPQGPVILLQRIGDSRTKTLAKLNIYSIQDFLDYKETEDGILSISRAIGLKSEAIVAIPSRNYWDSTFRRGCSVVQVKTYSDHR